MWIITILTDIIDTMGGDDIMDQMLLLEPWLALQSLPHSFGRFGFHFFGVEKVSSEMKIQHFWDN
jgi:hypothetical protein